MNSTDTILKNIIWGIRRKGDYESDKSNHSMHALCNGVYADEEEDERSSEYIKMGLKVSFRYIEINKLN